MITAHADTLALSERLKARAERLARHRSETVTRKARPVRADWHSPRSLWPDIELD